MLLTLGSARMISSGREYSDGGRWEIREELFRWSVLSLEVTLIQPLTSSQTENFSRGKSEITVKTPEVLSTYHVLHVVDLDLN